MEKKDNKILNTRYLILAVFFFLAVLERTILDLGPNFEFITGFLILSSFYLGSKKSFWATLLLVALTDRLIGNSKIFLFTWSGFLIPALISSVVINKLSNQVTKLTTNKFAHYLSLPATGLIANLFFFTWTNFGVWLLDSWGMYSNDLLGLTASYFNALPFLRNQIISTLVVIPVGFAIIEFTGKSLILTRIRVPRLGKQII